ncbi:PspC domain-containing protein [Candidatus Woesearchaeota archaeon]|nr:PspC domain-containing protein [Candidatus Woesearchaeota archaeon]
MFRTIFFPLKMMLIFPFLLFVFMFWVWMLVDCIRSELKDADKIIWVLIIFFFSFIGALIYLIFVKLNRNYKGISVKMKTDKKIKKLYRSRKNRIIAGVCGGIGEYFNVDPTLIRLLWVFLIFIGGSGIFAYIIAWIIMPVRE